MMKKLFFILTILIFSARTALAFDCSNILVDPKINIISSYGKLIYNDTLSTAQITEIAKKFNLVESGLFANGLSTINVTFDITINTLGYPIGNSEFCVVPTDINIFLGFDLPIIYRSNGLIKDSCEYNLVTQHEKVHQQINKSTLEYYLPMFKHAASAIIKKITAIYTTDINEVKNISADLTKTYNQKLTPLVDYIKNQMLIEQKKLDNPSNYQFESTLCS